MSRFLPSDGLSGEIEIGNVTQDDLDGNDSADSVCSFVANGDRFDTFMAKSKLDCKHCTVRKEAIARVLPDAAARLGSYCTWSDHDISHYSHNVMVIKEHRAGYEFGPGFCKEIGLFFLLDSMDEDPFCDFEGSPTAYSKRLPPEGTSSEASLRFALSCIKKCTEEHADCRIDGEPRLPTRVLYVGTTEHPTLYLHESTNEQDGRQYVCLSHCWGEPSQVSSMLRTTTETIDSFKIQIPWSQLPKTFQDSVSFVRRLGIEYLWIDALCIIQNDESDKAREIGQMAGVYSNALLTISATSALGPTEGLFNTMSSAHVAFKLSKSAWDPEKSKYGTLYAQEVIPHVQPEQYRDYFPLLKRAWTFQERFLPRRVLHFTKQELAWECTSRYGCQCRSIGGRAHTEKQYSLPRSTSPSRAARNTRWKDAVETYSSMHLTYGPDVLRALSGFASAYNTLHPDQYLAGLWRASILEQLLWVRSQAGPRPLKYQAPSWSWASGSIGNGVVWKTEIAFRGLAQCLDACCVPAYDADPTGMVSSGYIKLAAKAAPGKLIKQASSDRPICQFRGREEEIWVDHHLESEELTIHVVAIGACHTWFVHGQRLHFLILSSNREDPDTFQRRGYFFCNLWIKFESLFAEGSSPEYKDWTTEEVEWWTSTSGDGWTEFTIV